jgi:hydrogenase-4 membrane subunit HyfE
MKKMYLMMINAAGVAAGFGSSKLAVGSKNLMVDVGKWLVGIALLAGTALVVYFLIRRAAASDEEKKMWEKRAAGAVICAILAVIGGAMMAVVASYYGVSTTDPLS